MNCLEPSICISLGLDLICKPFWESVTSQDKKSVFEICNIWCQILGCGVDTKFVRFLPKNECVQPNEFSINNNQFSSNYFKKSQNDNFISIEKSKTDLVFSFLVSNFDPSLLTNKLWLVFIWSKNFFFLKKKIQNGRLKKR